MQHTFPAHSSLGNIRGKSQFHFYRIFILHSDVTDFRLKVPEEIDRLFTGGKTIRSETWRTKTVKGTDPHLCVLRAELSWLVIWVWFRFLCFCWPLLFSACGWSCSVFNLTYSITVSIRDVITQMSNLFWKGFWKKNTAIYSALKWSFLKSHTTSIY